jgi:hypothetical protein
MIIKFWAGYQNGRQNFLIEGAYVKETDSEGVERFYGSVPWAPGGEATMTSISVITCKCREPLSDGQCLPTECAPSTQLNLKRLCNQTVPELKIPGAK